MIELVEEVEGWFSLSAFKVDAAGNEIPGTRREPVPTFRNLITNGGLNRMGTAQDWLNYCQVGSGSATPSPTDSALASRVASHSGLMSVVNVAQPSAPYYLSCTRTFRFEAGVATGNLSEVGIGWDTTGALFSRALILDTAGTPTTITVLADEVLDVTYQFRCYMPTVDTSGSIELGGVTYSWIGRASQVTEAGVPYAWMAPKAAILDYEGFNYLYNGAIGAITTEPAGDRVQGASVSNSQYSTDSFAREGTITFGLAGGNISGGAKAMAYVHGIGRYQIGFTPAIPKDATKVLTLKVRTAWARKAL